MNKLSSNLRILLNNAKISENELARRTGIPQQVINRILAGTNANPKISTLTPLAHYFMVNISQLIDEDFSLGFSNKKIELKEISLIDFESFAKFSIEQLLIQDQEQIIININIDTCFATKMLDDSMEPKFSNDSILIFDSNRKPLNGDFVLLVTNNEVLFRQIIIKENKYFQKCLNPSFVDYKLKLTNENAKILGVLIQSRMHFCSTT